MPDHADYELTLAAAHRRVDLLTELHLHHEDEPDPAAALAVVRAAQDLDREELAWALAVAVGRCA